MARVLCVAWHLSSMMYIGAAILSSTLSYMYTITTCDFLASVQTEFDRTTRCLVIVHARMLLWCRSLY